MAVNERFPRRIVIEGCAWYGDRLFYHTNAHPNDPAPVLGECKLPKSLIVLERIGDKVFVRDIWFDVIAVYRSKERIKRLKNGVPVKVIILELEKVIPYDTWYYRCF